MVYGVFVIMEQYDGTPYDKYISTHFMTGFTECDGAIDYFDKNNKNYHESLIVYEIPDGTIGYENKWKVICKGANIPKEALRYG
jgi:hypothetical protein